MTKRGLERDKIFFVGSSDHIYTDYVSYQETYE